MLEVIRSDKESDFITANNAIEKMTDIKKRRGSVEL
jgi:hypothetical protein